MDHHDAATTLRPFVWILVLLFVWNSILCTVPATISHVHAFASIPSKEYHHFKNRCSRFLSSTSLMARKVTIRIVGRKQGGEAWLEEACDMYLTRLKPSGLELVTEWFKNDAALIKAHKESLESLSSKYVPMVLLDPRGVRCSSETFTDHVYQWLEEGGSRLIFVIGGADGLPDELKQDLDNRNSGGKNPILLSLSDLTFTHQFARLVLIEQLYRATEIRKGSSYHK